MESIPFEVRRRVGRVYVALEVLDLTDAAVRAHLGVDENDLTGEDYARRQSIASAMSGNVRIVATATDPALGTPPFSPEHWRRSG